MDIKEAFISQYRAALTMLGELIDRCPDLVWADQTDQNPYCRIVYHSLFYTSLYLSENEDTFVPWVKHRPKAHRLEERTAETYSKEEMKSYLTEIGANLEQKIRAQHLADSSGFDWLPMDKARLQLYNIRHLQHHVGELTERLHQQNIYGFKWVD